MTEIITDRTIFFAEGGGQPGDGVVHIHLSDDSSKIATIFDTHDWVMQYPLHKDEVPFIVGDKVIFLELDWTFLFHHMQRHSW